MLAGMLTKRSLLVLALALVYAAPGQAAPLPEGKARVIDGDTLAFGAQPVRLHGIDAPELDQRCTGEDGKAWACGTWAKAQLAALVQGQDLRCAPRGADRYGRTVARCQVGGRDLGAAMVALGAAMAYRRYSGDYVAQETAARQARRGLWAGAPPVTPESHRHARLADPAPPADPACRIKGNIGSRGPIYHLPGQRDYDRVRIAVTRGERWFCTEAQARAAGFRKADR